MPKKEDFYIATLKSLRLQTTERGNVEFSKTLKQVQHENPIATEGMIQNIWPSHSPEESLAELKEGDQYFKVNLDVLAVVTGPVNRNYTLMNSLDDRGITGYYTAIFKVHMKGEPGSNVEVMLESEDGPALLDLCDQVVEAGGLQAFGQLYIDRDDYESHGLRCEHKMEAKTLAPFPAEGIDMKPINDPEVVRLLLRNGYPIPEDVP